MDRVTRHDLKTDKFATEVGHSVEYVSAHRSQLVRYGAAAIGILVLVVGITYYRRSAHQGRQAELAQALHVKEGVVGAAAQPGDPRPSFGSQTEKDNAVKKAFNDVIAKYGGSDEASVAHYELGSLAADAGQVAEAEKHFRAAAEAGDSNYQSVAKLSLAQILNNQGKTADAEKLLRDLIASPTPLVSKEQATFTLVRMLAQKNPAEARKLLAPYEKDSRVSIARSAAALSSELPQVAGGK